MIVVDGAVAAMVICTVLGFVGLRLYRASTHVDQVKRLEREIRDLRMLVAQIQYEAVTAQPYEPTLADLIITLIRKHYHPEGDK